jgi:hypothetical protein
MIWIEKEDRQKATAWFEQRRDARSIFSTAIELDRASSTGSGTAGGRTHVVVLVQGSAEGNS